MITSNYDAVNKLFICLIVLAPIVIVLCIIKYAILSIIRCLGYE